MTLKIYSENSNKDDVFIKFNTKAPAPLARLVSADGANWIPGVLIYADGSFCDEISVDRALCVGLVVKEEKQTDFVKDHSISVNLDKPMYVGPLCETSRAELLLALIEYVKLESLQHESLVF